MNMIVDAKKKQEWGDVYRLIYKQYLPIAEAGEIIVFDMALESMKDIARNCKNDPMAIDLMIAAYCELERVYQRAVTA